MSGSHSALRGRLRFGTCELDLERRLLLREGTVVDLQPRPFALLAYLIERRHRVVGREELIDAVWKGVSVNAQAVRFAVHAIRRAVGDDGDGQRVIRTVPRTGWQFVQPVRASDRSRPSEGEEGLLQREYALHAASLSLSRALEGEGRELLACGPAGIGKTAYLGQVRRMAERDGFRIGSVRCGGGEGAPALWPWAAVVRDLMGTARSEELRSLVSEENRELLWLLPELGDAGSAGGGGSRPDARGDARSSRLRLFHAISAQFRRWSEAAPLALFLDDLQHADPESVSLFQFLCDQLQGSRIFLAGSFRTGGAPSRRVEGLEELSRRSSLTSVRLEPLDEEGVGALVERIAGLPVGARVVADLTACTGGNPYFVQLVTDHLGSETRGRLFLRGERDLGSGVVPSSIQAIVDARLSEMDERAGSLIRVASAVGAEVPVGTLEAVLGSEEALGAIEGCVEVGMLKIIETEGSCAFPHALVREAVYAGLSVTERADLHGRIGEALERAAGSEVSPHCAEIARHYANASTARCRAKAVEYLSQAARWSVECAAFATAAHQLEWALRLTSDEVGEGVRTRSRVLIELGYVLGLDGKRERMKSVLLEAAGIGNATGDGALLASAALHYAPDLLVIETGVYDPTLVSLLENALSLLGDRRCAERCRVLARLAMALHWSEERRERLCALVREAREIADEIGDEELFRYVGRAERIALYSVEDPRRSLEGETRAPGGQGPSILLDDVLRITSLLQLGRVREVDVRVEEFACKQGSIGCASASWYVDMFKATRALMRGDYEEARERGRVSLEKGMLVQDQNAAHSYCLQFAMAAIDTGGLEGAETAVGEMAQRFPRVEGWYAGLCYLYAELGQRARALEILESLRVGEGVWSQPRRNSWFGAVCSLALACRVMGVSDVAEALYAVLKPMRGQLAVVGFGSFCWGATDRFLGNLAALRGDWGLASRHFGDAVRMNVRCGASPAVAHCYREMAYFGHRFGVGDADRFSEMAIRKARALGMRRLERQALEERSAR